MRLSRLAVILRWLIVLLLLFAVLATFTISCSSNSVYERGPLKDLVLRPRQGYQDKLTNKRCAEKKKGKCLKYDVLEFDFNDDQVRKTLRELKFICNVRGSQFVPCPNARGLCQLRKDTSGVWPFKKTEIKLNRYISLHDDLEFLVGANTYCASIDSVIGQEMFGK